MSLRLVVPSYSIVVVVVLLASLTAIEVSIVRLLLLIIPSFLNEAAQQLDENLRIAALTCHSELSVSDLFTLHAADRRERASKQQQL